MTEQMWPRPLMWPKPLSKEEKDWYNTLSGIEKLKEALPGSEILRHPDRKRRGFYGPHIEEAPCRYGFKGPYLKWKGQVIAEHWDLCGPQARLPRVPGYIKLTAVTLENFDSIVLGIKEAYDEEKEL